MRILLEIGLLFLSFSPSALAFEIDLEKTQRLQFYKCKHIKEGMDTKTDEDKLLIWLLALAELEKEYPREAQEIKEYRETIISQYITNPEMREEITNFLIRTTPNPNDCINNSN